MHKRAPASRMAADCPQAPPPPLVHRVGPRHQSAEQTSHHHRLARVLHSRWLLKRVKKRRTPRGPSDSSCANSGCGTARQRPPASDCEETQRSRTACSVNQRPVAGGWGSPRRFQARDGGKQMGAVMRSPRRLWPGQPYPQLPGSFAPGRPRAGEARPPGPRSAWMLLPGGPRSRG